MYVTYIVYVWLNTLTIKVISWKTTWWILLLPVLDDAFRRVPPHSDASRRVPTNSDASWHVWRTLKCCHLPTLGSTLFVQTFELLNDESRDLSQVWWRVLTHSDMSRRILTHSDTSWCVPTHSDASWHVVTDFEVLPLADAWDHVICSNLELLAD